MGYRHYMYVISKETVYTIQSMQLDELGKSYHDDGEDSFRIHNLPIEMLHNFGEMDSDSAERIYQIGIPLFADKDVMRELENYKPYIVGKQGLIESINIYREKVINYYKGLQEDTVNEYFTDENRTSIEKQEAHVQNILREWERFPPINLNENVEVITSSWKFEYSIFELVRKLKTIDFDKNTILFFGF